MERTTPILQIKLIMKKLILLSALSIFTCQLQAQIYVEGVQLDRTNTGNYLAIAVGGIGTQHIIDVDYGQPNKPAFGFTRLTNEKGEAIKFRGAIDALNYFYEHGWEFIEEMNTRGDGISGYLLRRKNADGAKY